eukprot:56011-Eustigmatos_ZCMA.PRE.1
MTASTTCHHRRSRHLETHLELLSTSTACVILSQEVGRIYPPHVHYHDPERRQSVTGNISSSVVVRTRRGI